MKMHCLLPIIAAALLLAPPSQAQTGKLYRVGFLSPGGFAPGTNPGRLTEEIARRLAQTGFTPGANLELVKRGGGGHYERLPGRVGISNACRGWGRSWWRRRSMSSSPSAIPVRRPRRKARARFPP